MASVLLARLAALLAALVLAACAAPQLAPAEPMVSITIHPEADGLRVRYVLPEPASSFTFRNNAADIRTSSWRALTPGATLTTNEIAFAEPEQSFEIALAPDLVDRDRVYPALGRVGEGWLLYPLHLQEPRPTARPFTMDFDIPPDWVVLGRRNTDDKLGLDGWIYFGPASQVERGAAIVATDPATPAWLRAEILDAANAAAVLFAERLAAELGSEPTIIISYTPGETSAGMRGDTTAGAMMSVRFHGDVWQERRGSASASVREFLAHEIFHFWNGDLADSAENSRRPWLHEGGASYAALLAVSPPPASFLATLNENFHYCQTALPAADSLLTVSMQAGRAPYACGVVLQWAWDIGRRATASGDVLTFWREIIADAATRDRLYSITSARRLAPATASRAADVLLDISGDARWQSFADAAMAYGAGLSIGRNGQADRSVALMHLIGEQCTGSHGFYEEGDRIKLDTGDRCGPLNGDSVVDTVAGVAISGDGSALYDTVREFCASGETVTYTLGGIVVAEAPCMRPLAPAKPSWTIDRAFAFGM